MSPATVPRQLRREKLPRHRPRLMKARSVPRGPTPGSLREETAVGSICKEANPVRTRFLTHRSLRLPERSKACGSCPRYENVETQKAGFPHFHSALGNSPPQESARASFPQLPQGPPTGSLLSRKERQRPNPGLENESSNCRRRKK